LAITTVAAVYAAAPLLFPLTVGLLLTLLAFWLLNRFGLGPHMVWFAIMVLGGFVWFALFHS
jgi:hypothetical protein